MSRQRLAHFKVPLMRRKLLAVAAIVALLALPFAAAAVYQALTAFPPRIRIASGPEGGRYRVIAERLKTALESQWGVEVEVLDTDGSLENLALLRSGGAELAIYQRSAERMLAPQQEPDNRHVTGIANLYADAVHVIARRDSGIASPGDLRGKRLAVASRRSGSFVMSKLLLEEYGLEAEVEKARDLNYAAIRQGLRDGSLDAAIITSSVDSPIFHDLLAGGACRLVPLPHTEVLVAKHMALSPHAIPAGFYRLAEPIQPPADVPTVTLRAQLLARAELPRGFVEELTRLLMQESFLQENHLAELSAGGKAFAREKLEFPLHRGALNYYDPELRPFINPDFVEATEGLRSLVVSVLIAGFLGVRWLRQRRARRQEHKLDRFIRQLLEIEQQQLALDKSEGWCDLEKLQSLLEEVTALRHAALHQFSAHELNEDRAVDCLLELCQALTEKINAKISRQRIDKRFAELGSAVRQGTSGESS